MDGFPRRIKQKTNKVKSHALYIDLYKFSKSKTLIISKSFSFCLFNVSSREWLFFVNFFHLWYLNRKIWENFNILINNAVAYILFLYFLSLLPSDKNEAVI